MNDNNNNLNFLFNRRDLSLFFCSSAGRLFQKCLSRLGTSLPSSARTMGKDPSMQSRHGPIAVRSCSPLTKISTKRSWRAAQSEEQVEDLENFTSNQVSVQVSWILAYCCCSVLWNFDTSRSIYQPSVSFDSHTSVTYSSWTHLVAFPENCCLFSSFITLDRKLRHMFVNVNLHSSLAVPVKLFHSVFTRYELVKTKKATSKSVLESV